jgi:hypothetical protein
MDLYFAGGESHMKMLYSTGCRKILMSYTYIKKKGIQNLDVAFKLSIKERVKLFIDSGAFTLRQDATLTKEAVEKYVKRYCKWLIANKQYITCAAEVDVDNVLGHDFVERLRKKYFIPLEKEHGIPIVYVWHSEHSKSEYLDMCKRFGYVGVAIDGNATGQKLDVAKAALLLNKAKRTNTKVHGFAMNKPTIISKVKFASTDATSWLAGMQYGVTYIWDGHNFITLNKKQKHLRKQYKRKWEKLGLDWNKIAADDPYEITKANIHAFLAYEKHLNKRERMRSESLIPNNTKSASEPAEEGITKEPSEPMDTMPPVISNVISLLDDPEVPYLRCATCYISDDCPKFEEDRPRCAFNFKQPQANTADDFLNIRVELFKTKYQRIQLNLTFERINGGYMDRSLQTALDNLSNEARDLERDMRPKAVRPSSAFSILARNAAEESRDEVTALPTQAPQNMLGALFGELVNGISEANKRALPKAEEPMTIVQETRSDMLDPVETVSPKEALLQHKLDRKKKHG